MRMIALVAVAATLAVVPAAAQKADCPRVVPPPTIYAPPTPLQRPCERGSDARVQMPGSALFLCVGRTLGGPVVATVDAAGGAAGSPSEIDVPMAIAILADTRMSALWPDVEAVLGAGGDGLRTAMLERARIAARRDSASPLTWQRGSLESLNDAASRATLDLARVLDLAGRSDQALALLDAELPALRADGEVGDSREYSRLSNRLRYANLLYTNRRHDEAVAVLAAVENDDMLGQDYRINAMVNRAAYLAEMGRSADALALIARAQEAFNDTDGSYSVDGSARQFAWIRACALHRLGRIDEARRAMRVLDASPERLPSRTGAVVPVTSSIELRAALCLDDVDRLAGLLRERRDTMPFALGHILQDGWPFSHARNAATIQAARARIEAQGVRLPVRSIPERYAPMVRRAPLGAAPATSTP